MTSRELPQPVKKYGDYRELCQDPEIDAVMVATPNQVHVPVALEAVKNGKHVLVTKPLSHSEETARELVEAAEAAGVVNMMSLGMRFSTPTIYLKDLVEEGEFGELYYAQALSVRRSGIPDWNSAFIEPGGAPSVIWGCTCLMWPGGSGKAEADQRDGCGGRQVRASRRGLLELCPAAPGLLVALWR